MSHKNTKKPNLRVATLFHFSNNNPASRDNLTDPTTITATVSSFVGTVTLKKV